MNYLEWCKLAAKRQADKFSHIRNGMPIVECEYLTDTGEKVVARTWRERFFSWPWRPLEKTKVVYMQVPRQDFYVVDGRIVCHPAIAARIREVIESL